MTRDKTHILSKALDDYQVMLAMQGDKQAFTLLYKRWHPRLLKFAYRLIRDSEAAQDVMQDAAITIAKNINKLQDPSKFSAWAYTIVRRRSADYIQRQVKDRNLKSRFQQDTVPPISRAVEEGISLKQALGRLPNDDQILLKLFYSDGMTGTEISAAMGLPLGTVKSRLFTARAKLKSIYVSHEEGETNDEI